MDLSLVQLQPIRPGFTDSTIPAAVPNEVISVVVVHNFFFSFKIPGLISISSPTLKY